MRKLMLLAAMLAMVLVAAAPALAQTATAGDSGDTTTTTYTSIDCSQVQDAAANQYGGDATASGDSSAASVANELGISEEQANACLGGNAGTGNSNVGDTGTTVPASVVEEEVACGCDVNGDGVVSTSEDTSSSSSSSASSESSSSSESSAASEAGVTTLPDTGGASLFTLGAGALLVGGGLLARRIFR